MGSTDYGTEINADCEVQPCCSVDARIELESTTRGVSRVRSSGPAIAPMAGQREWHSRSCANARRAVRSRSSAAFVVMSSRLPPFLKSRSLQESRTSRSRGMRRVNGAGARRPSWCSRAARNPSAAHSRALKLFSPRIAAGRRSARRGGR